MIAFEYLQIKKLTLPALPVVRSLKSLFEWEAPDIYRASETAGHYVAHFHEYLVRGGFPQAAQVESVTQAQRLLREDIIDRVVFLDFAPPVATTRSSLRLTDLNLSASNNRLEMTDALREIVRTLSSA